MKTYYLHSETKTGNKFTLAAQQRDDIILVGIAICSSKDKFCKRTGRSIAETRLNTHKLDKAYEKGYVDTLNVKKDLITTLRLFAEEYAENN